ncbi:MAG: Ig-like domain-containing protein [Bacteroidota bacterium]
MTRLTRTGLFAFLLLAAPASAQVTGLSEWSLYLDPGHSQTENQGIYGYSEAEKVLRVGLALREMLLGRTDIDTVYIVRTNDQQQVSLRQRADQANGLGADFFHSIHSDAGPPEINRVFALYGGWRDASTGAIVEKSPQGGARMGGEMMTSHSVAMRLPLLNRNRTDGSIADRPFGIVSACDVSFQRPCLFVNRETTMASVLTESGYHTNPRQNTLNMNADWKRLEAQGFYWAILDWHEIPRTTHRIATGIVTDVESGRPINGATVTASGQTYTTDTYESLFSRYSNDPDELANGFYYLEDVPAGTLTVTAEAEGYESASVQVTVQDTTFTFADLALVSTVPPVVVDADPEAGEDGHPVTDPIRLEFSRPLDAATAEPAFSLVPTAGGDPVAGTIAFERNGYELVFTPDAPLAARTDYTLTLAASATTANGNALDGDSDGTAGSDFVLTFVSSFPDTSAPRLSASDPSPNSQGSELQPVVTVTFNEEIDPATLDGRVVLEINGGATVAGAFVHELAGVVGETPDARSTVSFAPNAPLAADTRYRFAIESGVEDRFGNASTSPYAFSFTTGSSEPSVRVLEDFEGSSVSDDWWVPQQSGSTAGIETDSTSVAASDRSYPLGGDTSMRIDFGWSDGASSWLIRECFGGCSPSHSFTSAETLRLRVFGDGTGVLFRFAVDDGTSGIEVSPWTAVDWYGWRTVTWDLDADGFGSWIGNGTWDSPSQLRMESLQLGYDGAGARFGELYVDDLAVLRPGSVSADEAPVDGLLQVDPVSPNPAGTAARVRIALGQPATVTAEVFNAIGQRVAVLADRQQATAGPLDWEIPVRRLAVGTYVVRITADGEQTVTSFVVAR